MAADAYHQGTCTTRKMLALRERAHTLTFFSPPPQDLHQKGALFETMPWIKATVCTQEELKKQHILLQQKRWIQLWYQCREHTLQSIRRGDAEQPNSLSFWVMRSTGTPIFVTHPNLLAPKNAFQRLDKALYSHPYVLRHLEQSDFVHHAHIWIPALYNPELSARFSYMLQQSLPFDPNKHALAELSKEIHQVYTQATTQNTIHAACVTIVNATWCFFKKLEAFVTKSHWACSLNILRNIPFVDIYIMTHPDSISTVFAVRGCQGSPQTARTGRSQAEYCAQQHLEPLLAQRAQLITRLYAPLEKGQPQKHAAWQSLSNAPFFYHPRGASSTICCLNRQKIAIRSMLYTRCDFLWRLAKELHLRADFCALYNACTPAEKRYLKAQAKKHCPPEDRLQRIFVYTTDPPEDFERLHDLPKMPQAHHEH